MKSNWKEVAEVFYKEFSEEDIEEILNMEIIRVFSEPTGEDNIKGLKQGKAAIKVLNQYYTNELKKALKQYKPEK